MDLKTYITQDSKETFLTIKSLKKKTNYCFKIAKIEGKTRYFVSILEGTIEAPSFNYLGYFDNAKNGLTFYCKRDAKDNAFICFSHVIQNIAQVERDTRLNLSRKFEKHIY